jgi:organic radical activating enzyme
MSSFEWKVFFKRNIKRYAVDYIRFKFNLHTKASEYNLFTKAFLAFASGLKSLQLLFGFIFFGKLYIPYLDFIITTRCTLKCKDCITYIPTIEEHFQKTLSFDEFKNYLDNLLKNISSIFVLNLVGGEPFLNKDFAKIFAYCLEQRKIKRMSFITNATIDPSEEILALCKKYSKKLIFGISNYSGNPDLNSIVKFDALIAKLKANGIKPSYYESPSWHPVSEIKDYNRTPAQRINYYLQCLNFCVSASPTGIIATCQRAATFAIRKIAPPQETALRQYINLSKVVNKKDFVSFYSNADFSACGFCNHLEDQNKKTGTALQIK